METDEVPCLSGTPNERKLLADLAEAYWRCCFGIRSRRAPEYDELGKLADDNCPLVEALARRMAAGDAIRPGQVVTAWPLVTAAAHIRRLRVAPLERLLFSQPLARLYDQGDLADCAQEGLGGRKDELLDFLDYWGEALSYFAKGDLVCHPCDGSLPQVAVDAQYELEAYCKDLVWSSRAGREPLLEQRSMAASAVTVLVEPAVRWAMAAGRVSGPAAPAKSAAGLDGRLEFGAVSCWCHCPQTVLLIGRSVPLFPPAGHRGRGMTLMARLGAARCDRGGNEGTTESIPSGWHHESSRPKLPMNAQGGDWGAPAPASQHW
jgi:hypothetical protein